MVMKSPKSSHPSSCLPSPLSLLATPAASAAQTRDCPVSALGRYASWQSREQVLESVADRRLRSLQLRRLAHRATANHSYEGGPCLPVFNVASCGSPSETSRQQPGRYEGLCWSNMGQLTQGLTRRELNRQLWSLGKDIQYTSRGTRQRPDT